MEKPQSTWGYAYEQWKGALGGVVGFACLVLLPAGFGVIGGLGPNVNIVNAIVGALIGAVVGPLAFYLFHLAAAPYQLLKRSREQCRALEAQLKPMIKLSFGGIHSIVEQYRPQVPGPQFEAPARALRIRVECVSGSYVTGVPYLTRMLFSPDAATPFSEVDLQGPLEINGDVRASRAIVATFEFFRAHSDDKLTFNGRWPLHIKDDLAQIGLYQLALVLSWYDQEDSVCVEVNWQGRMDTVTAREIPALTSS